MKLQATIKILLLAIIVVLSAAAQTTSVAPQKPLTRAQILALLAGDVPSSRVTILVQERGTDFTTNDAFLDQIRKGGGEDDLVAALQSAQANRNAAAPTTIPVTGVPSTSARPAPDARLEEAKQEQLAQHTARGAELMQTHHYAEAEAEYRAAIKLDPQNSYLHIALARALNGQRKTDEALKEARLAVHLSPDSDLAHFCLGNTLRFQEDYAGAAAEFREAVRLNPKYDMAYNNLGYALEKQENEDGAMAEYRRAVSLNPRNNTAETNLGNALERKGDLDGAIAQFREIVRQRPRLPAPHYRLGQLLEKNGEPRKALNQYREAVDLAPENRTFKAAYERAKRNQ
jgi:tetratricopeptide (TPR) repeat protein